MASPFAPDPNAYSVDVPPYNFPSVPKGVPTSGNFNPGAHGPAFSIASKQSASTATDPFGPLPQENLPAAPAPEKAADFTPATYEPPKKGMEYLAAGLSLLFPGSPISYAATGLASGLTQSAQDKYSRQEKQAEQQYDITQKKADVEHQNALDAYNYGSQQAQLAYQNALAQRQNRMDMASRGIDWRTGQAFKYPTLQQVGAKNDYASTMQGYQHLIQLAQRNGDTASATLYGQQMQDYDAQQKALAKDMFDVQKELMIQSREDARAQYSAQQSWARTVFTQQQENWRHDTSGTVASLKNIRSEQFKVFQAFTTPQAARNPLTGQYEIKPPLFSAGMLPSVRTAMSQIDKSTDPQGLADRLAAHTKDPQAKAFFTQYGMLAAQGMQQAGIPIIPLPPQKPPVQSGPAPRPGLLTPNEVQTYVNAAGNIPLNQAEHQLKLSTSLNPEQKKQIYTALQLYWRQKNNPEPTITNAI